MSHIEKLAKTGEQKQQPARGFDSYGLLACLAISIFFIVWITLASKSLTLGSVVFLFVLPWVLLRAGAIITAALRLPSFFALDFLLGVAAVSVAVMAWKVFVPLSLWVLLIVLLIAIAGIPKLLPTQQRDPLSALGLLGVIVSLACSNGLVSRPDFANEPGPGRHCVQAVVGFFLPRHYRDRQPETSNFVSSRQLRVERVSSDLLSLRQLLTRLVFGQGRARAGLCYRSGFLGAIWIIPHRVSQLCPGDGFLESGSGTSSSHGCPSNTGRRFVEHRPSPLQLFLAPTRCSWRSLWCRNRRNSANTYRPGSARRTTCLDRVRSGSGCASGSFQGPSLHGGISAAAFLCHSCLATTQVAGDGSYLGGVCVSGVALLPLANRFYVGPNVHFDFSGSALYWKLLAKMASGTRVESWYQVFRR